MNQVESGPKKFKEDESSKDENQTKIKSKDRLDILVLPIIFCRT